MEIYVLQYLTNEILLIFQLSIFQLSGNIPEDGSYGVFTGELVRYARACTFYADFKSRTLLLVEKLKTQFFVNKKLKKTFLKFCENHILLIQKYGSFIRNLHNDW